MFPVEARQEAALADPVWMLRLYKRVAYGLAPRLEDGGPRVLLHAFLAADRRCVASRDAPVEPRGAAAAVGPIFPSAVLARQEVNLLLHVLPLEECHVETEESVLEGGVRIGDVLLALRELIPFQAWQVHAVVLAVRAVVEKSETMTPFEEHVTDLLDYASSTRRQAREAPPPPLTVQEALTFFDRACGLSVSQAHLFLHYITCSEEEEEEMIEGDEGSDRGGTAFSGEKNIDEQGLKKGRAGAAAERTPMHSRGPPWDLRLLHQLLFTPEVPGVAEYPLLMGRLAESCRDGGDGDPPRPTGSLALHSSLRAMELTYPSSPSSSPATGAARAPVASDLDFGELVQAELSPRQFFYLCKTMQTGFEQRESDQLFYYLKKEHHSSAGVLVRDVVAAFRQYFPPVSMSVLQLVQAATVRHVRHSSRDGLAFVRLYTSLQSWGTAQIPIRAFVEAFRAAGVPDGLAGVLDIELEWLRLKAPTRVDLLLMLCSPVPPSRTAVIQKLFERLDTAGAGVVPCTAYLQRFEPEAIEGASVRRQVGPWKTALEAYVQELREETLSYELFAYFWYMISAGLEDDPTFTVAIWQGFGLADDGRRQRRR